MKCEKCNHHEATVHVTTIHNGHKQAHHLCETCAGKNEYGNIMWKQFNLWDNEFFKSLLSPSQFPTDERLVCEGCGMHYEDFSRGGKLGCPVCYRSFSAKLLPIIQRWQGADRHVGKVPTGDIQTVRSSQELQRLRQELMRAVSAEDYETAAQLRDKIRILEEECKIKGAEHHGY